jgi:hypothetical protein
MPFLASQKDVPAPSWQCRPVTAKLGVIMFAALPRIRRTLCEAGASYSRRATKEQA